MTTSQEKITLQETSKEIQEDQIKPKNQNILQKNEKEEPQYFYLLLIRQLVVVLISTFLLNKNWFLYQNNYSKSNISFEVYCQKFGKCSGYYNQYTIQQYQQDVNQYEVWKTNSFQESLVYTKLYYYSIIMYPLFLILQSIFRNCQLFKKRQKLFHYLQYPLISLFIQACTSRINNSELKDSCNRFRELIIFLMGYVSFLYLNQKYFKWQLEIKSTTQKFVNCSFIIISLKGILDFIALNNSNYIPQMLLILYIQVYLLHINANLFQQNYKYMIHNQSVLCLIIIKLKSIFDVQDVYKQIAETHFVISRKMMKNGIIGIILTIILRDYIFSFFTLFILGGFLLISIWDTSLVSTSSKLTLKDQYQAASLFFLDILMPIRNIIMLLVI